MQDLQKSRIHLWMPQRLAFACLISACCLLPAASSAGGTGGGSGSWDIENSGISASPIDQNVLPIKPEDKIDSELKKTVLESSKIEDNLTKLHLEIKLESTQSDHSAVALLVKKLHITVLTINAAGNRMIAVVPVRRINELSASKLISRLSLAQ